MASSVVDPALSAFPRYTMIDRPIGVFLLIPFVFFFFCFLIVAHHRCSLPSDDHGGSTSALDRSPRRPSTAHPSRPVSPPLGAPRSAPACSHHQQTVSPKPYHSPNSTPRPSNPRRTSIWTKTRSRGPTRRSTIRVTPGE
jgi:hypothetical protein